MSRPGGGVKPPVDFTEGSVLGAVARMGLPSMIGFAATSVYDIVNMLWVSRLPGAPVAAITFFFPFYWLLSSVNQVAGSGSVAMISRRYGERDYEGAEAAIKDAILLKVLLALAVGLPGSLILAPGLRLVGTTPEAWDQAMAYGHIMLLGLAANFSSYTMFTALRSVGEPRWSMVLMLCGVLLNVVLDPLLIFGLGPLPALGVRGAAIASIIAYTCTSLGGLVIFVSGRGNVRVRLRGGPGLSWRRMGRMLAIGLPSGLSSFSFSLGRTVLMPWIAVYGTAVVAADGVAMRLAGFGIMLIVGMGLGLSALIGQTLGAGKQERTWAVALRSLQFGAGAMAIYGTLLLIGAPWIARGFFPGGPELEATITTLRVLAIGLPFNGLGIMLDMTCSGAGETRVPLAFNALQTWVLQVPGVYLVARVLELPYAAVWWAITAALAIPPLIFWQYFRTRRWMQRAV